jgi:phosphoglycolate phosphatase
MSPPAAILFDWDNTLVDSWHSIHGALARTLESMGHEPWDLAETKRRVALSLRDSFPALFGERWEEARQIYYDSFAEIHLAHLKPLPGAPDILERLNKAGIPMGIVSNKSGGFLRKEVAHLGWSSHFRHLIGAGDAKADKPSDLPVRMALEVIGVPADANVWFIGDAPVDMECAANAGIRGLVVRHDEELDEGFIARPPERIFKSWSAFGSFLNEIPVP